ncbi:hypothetical protein ACODUI_13245 [Stenotrophomonas geniculata]
MVYFGSDRNRIFTKEKVVLKGCFAGLLALVGFISFAPAVEAKAVRCDTCTRDLDFRNEAVRLGAGTHLVYNVSANLIQQYYIGYDNTGGGGGGGGVVPRAAGPVVQRQTPPSGAVEEVKRAHQVMVEGGGTLRPTYIVPVDVLGLNPSASAKTAYDYVGDHNLRAMVESAAGSTGVITKIVGASVLTAMSDLLQHVTNYTGLRDQARLLMRIVFKDGSYVTVVVNLEYQNGQSEVGSERTAAGQLIPSDIQQVQGEWTDYNGENLGQMVTHLHGLGATMTSSGPSSGSVQAITCSGAGAAKTCHVQYMIR